MIDFAHYPSLTDKTAFVTGGATGIGAEIVRAFVRQGVHVGFVDIADEAGRKLCQSMQTAGGKVWYRKVDVTDPAALKDAIAGFEAETGPIHALVNNVANDTRHGWRDLPPEAWDQSMQVNLRPAFLAIQAAAPAMLQQGAGTIINFGSISWKVKQGDMPAYTTAKAAIHGLTKSFVTEFGAAGVRINTVMPGWVLTDKQLNEHFDENGAEALRLNQPMKGTIDPRDAAALVMFLASDDSRMCTGQEFTIDGGWT